MRKRTYSSWMDEFERGVVQGHNDAVNDYNEEVEQLCAELAQCRKDAEQVTALRAEVGELRELLSKFADWYVPDHHECEDGTSKEYCGRCIFEAAALRQTVDIR